MERAELRDLVLFLLGFVYLVAFTSVFLQADGLFGVNGLEPVHKVAGRVSQERAGVLWWARPAGTGADEWLDMIAVAGIVASVLVTAGFAYIPLLALCWLLYLSILLVGQTFLSFQWDIFLLEVGGLALLYAPASPLSAKRKPSAVSIMCLRWCLFKIMLMSGVVKIQASEGVFARMKLENMPDPPEDGEVINGRRYVRMDTRSMGADSERYRVIWPEPSNGPGSKLRSSSFTLSGNHCNETLFVFAEHLRAQGVNFVGLANKHGNRFRDSRLNGTKLAYLSTDRFHSILANSDLFLKPTPEDSGPSGGQIHEPALHR